MLLRVGIIWSFIVVFCYRGKFRTISMECCRIQLSTRFYRSLSLSLSTHTLAPSSPSQSLEREGLISLNHMTSPLLNPELTSSKQDSIYCLPIL